MSTTILVVDDSQTDFLYVRRILEANGFNVAYSPSGQAALTDVKKVKPALILMDVVMPEMNGFQATRALSKDPECQNIPVIVLSSKSEKTDVVWAMRQGARDYLVKPVDPTALITAVNKLV